MDILKLLQLSGEIIAAIAHARAVGKDDEDIPIPPIEWSYKGYHYIIDGIKVRKK